MGKVWALKKRAWFARIRVRIRILVRGWVAGEPQKDHLWDTSTCFPGAAAAANRADGHSGAEFLDGTGIWPGTGHPATQRDAPPALDRSVTIMSPSLSTGVKGPQANAAVVEAKDPTDSDNAPPPHPLVVPPMEATTLQYSPSSSSPPPLLGSLLQRATTTAGRDFCGAPRLEEPLNDSGIYIDSGITKKGRLITLLEQVITHQRK
jgi:hypothetical protein